MVGNNGTRGALGRRSNLFRIAREAARGNTLPLEIVLVVVDLLLLAIGEKDVVAEKQVQVFVPVARQPLDDGLELKQQVVAECAHQAEVRILFLAELFDQRPQDGEHRRLPAALLLGKQRGHGFQPAGQQARFEAELFPVGVAGQHRMEHLEDLAAALIERVELDAAVVGDDLERRTSGADVPARISPGILVSRGEINSTVAIQLARQVRQPSSVDHLGDGASDFDPVGSRIAVFAHRLVPWGN